METDALHHTLHDSGVGLLYLFTYERSIANSGGFTIPHVLEIVSVFFFAPRKVVTRHDDHEGCPFCVIASVSQETSQHDIYFQRTILELFPIVLVSYIGTYCVLQVVSNTILAHRVIKGHISIRFSCCRTDVPLYSNYVL